MAERLERAPAVGVRPREREPEIGLEGERQAVDARGGAVLDAELQLLATATQVEI